MEQKKPFSAIVAEKLIEQLKAGTAPWQKPWQPGAPNGFLPLNPTTGKRYKGINALYLMSQGRSDPRWMTYKQASSAGAQVNKGEKGTSIQYWKFNEERDKLDDNGKPVLDSKGNPAKEIIMLERPRVFFATVFNAEQIDGLPSLQLQPKAEQKWDAVERAEHILNASGAKIIHTPGNRAFYRSGVDSITMPERSQFETADRYYATALHELGHWTGHKSRLDRDLANPFGSEAYAKEELRAEIASMILGDELGVGHDPGQHAAYVGSWIKALQDDHLEIFRAAADAEKIHDYVLAFEQKQIQNLPQEQGEDMPQLPGQLDEVTETLTPNDLAESWTLKQLEKGTLSRALDSANHEQIKRVIATLDAMQPLNTQNEFWKRHELPQHIEVKINQAGEYLEGRRIDALVAEARKAGDLEGMNKATEALGFSLPDDWNGRVQVQGNVIQEVGGQEYVEPAHSLGAEPDFWGVYAQHENGTHQWLVDYKYEEQAENMAERLAIIDANSEVSELEKAVKLARVQEERVRRDPNSSNEDVSAAKEARITAEAAALISGGEAEGKHQEPSKEPQADRTYINVPYREKDEAKALGARWDRPQQSWYVASNIDAAPFAKWMPSASKAVDTSQDTHSQDQNQNTSPQRVYLAVPYGERIVAKSAGAEWDKAAKSWYAGEGADMERLKRWLPENVQAEQGPAMTPREEFADALKSLGCVVSGEHPIMDGKKHRINVEGDKKGEKAGFYVAYLDGHPAGYVKNNRTGIDMTWKSKGYSLDPAERAKLQAEAATKLADRAAEQERAQEATAKRVTRQMESLEAIKLPTPYLEVKGIQAHAGVMTDKEGKKTYIPAFDADGKQWTMQYIQEDGTKRFAKDSRKEGCFHPVGGMDAIAAAPVLVIAEGYATAATLAEATGQATVAAFDSGNLEAVARALHDKYPEKPIIIAGDDDRHLEITQGVNPGRSKAEAAAKAVSGKAITPIFSPGENSYPTDLPQITPHSYREHERAKDRLEAADAGKVQITEKEVAELQRALLTPEQLSALSGMKSHTDFNDLATRSALGWDGVERQVLAALSQAEKKQKRVPKIQKQEQKQRRVLGV